MKKLLLLSLALCIGLISYTQQKPVVKPDAQKVTISKFDKKQMPYADKVGVKEQLLSVKPTPNRGITGDPNVITIIEIGSSANAFGYGLSNGNATFVWADDDLHTVTNTHRMGGDVGPPGQYSGDLAYDISTDQGITWTNQIKIYESNITSGQDNSDAARYPQGAIYNPPENTDPNNAWVAFFAPNLDGSNGGSWGGYSYGVASIGDPEDTTKHLLSSDIPNGFYQGVPTAFHITQQGEAWMADAALIDSYLDYTGNIIFMHGVFNDDINDYEYEEFLAPAICEDAGSLKMAFSPDGQIGYVFWIDINQSIPFYDEDGWDYPLLFKTEDGGETWDSDLISIQLGGPGGIETIKYWLSDEQLNEYFEPGTWNRDEIIYSARWWNSDIAVDAGGNPHLITSVHVGWEDGGSLYIGVEPYTMGIFDIYSLDGGVIIDQAVLLGTTKTYRGIFQPNDFTEYNRTGVSTTMDGTKMFFSWIDTQADGINENIAPDIFARGFDLVTNMLTEGESSGGSTNVTALSTGMWQSWSKAASYYVFTDNDDFIMPLVYQFLDPENVANPIRFNYIQDFSFNIADFTLPSGNDPFPWVGIENQEMITTEVSQNYPNPFNNTSLISVKLEEPARLSLEVTNILGQKVYMEDRGYTGQHTVQFILNADDFDPGIYFYTVRFGNQAVTRQMIVK
ncbi:MAG: T9SS type A sorting domain-containing protein [Bacteroidetes bacterium]|nr:T9SS type A sorting domain-containing protein [Bacteroidota bacterium]